ncbi:hypothetical protein ACLKA6_000432, partial [Drosophila palustris]
MDTNINITNEAEKPPQPEVVDLSTTVEPMDADDGLDLDPYSPVGSTNIEEMEELLNSPPRAEPTPKDAKGARNRLSGAARKRLKHYKAKGLTIEQALAMAKQPLPNPRKRPNAGDSLKRGSSANTTPESNMPKRGSAKPGAGATPASDPELKAASADQQAEQPPISRPAARTEPREHPSYSAVTSAEKFAVIPSGYPKVLLSTKELSAVQEAILDVIRTQRQGAVKPSFTGCTFRPGWLLISCANRETADWLKAAMPKLKLWPGAKLLEGQNSALRTGDWRILNRVERGKQIELTFAVDPNSDEKLKSVGHRLCYGFGQVIVRQRSKHSAEAKDAPTATAPVPAKTAQTPILSQEVPSCSKSLTPTTRSGEEQSLEAASSTMAAPTANASVATTERPAHHRSPGCVHPYMVGSKVSTKFWNNPNLCIPSGAQVWYTDGSKLENGDTGAGVYGPRFRRSLAMGKTPSIFQAEIHAIEVCAIECIRLRIQ